MSFYLLDYYSDEEEQENRDCDLEDDPEKEYSSLNKNAHENLNFSEQKNNPKVKLYNKTVESQGNETFEGDSLSERLSSVPIRQPSLVMKEAKIDIERLRLCEKPGKLFKRFNEKVPASNIEVNCPNELNALPRRDDDEPELKYAKVDNEIENDDDNDNELNNFPCRGHDKPEMKFAKVNNEIENDDNDNEPNDASDLHCRNHFEPGKKYAKVDIKIHNINEPNEIKSAKVNNEINKINNDDNYELNTASDTPKIDHDGTEVKNSNAENDNNENVIAETVSDYVDYGDNDSDSESGRLVIDT